MYSFQTDHTRRKKRRFQTFFIALSILLLIIVGVLSWSLIRARSANESVSSALAIRVNSEAGSARDATNRLTQSSGTNSSSLLSAVHAHIYAIECLNQLSASIYGPDIKPVNEAQLAACEELITECETRLQAGGVVTEQYTALRDAVYEITKSLGIE